ncbi:olfactory receptor 5AS1-like [Falco biarmicus]|uniref:olfactory receptor 5AS1-like n=1 Tax=Falco rusticolus TaxID=120794 RepID=UPI0006789E61|nr:olfactory receptor 5AS1-like [Falco rusticolus]XP_055579039.1 olfactory receptor 5AS1-like [Falco cherrug]XP_055669436.1 olfactory receptor 5AS1-like [Falco peregrinus]XP_056210905.1 olfactory receptor 5AS1-like [Falco biarmicus]
MPEENRTALTEFVLLGFTDRLEVEIPLFGLFLLIYAITLVGNVGLVMLVQLNASLHTPMYYFLSNLSFLDLSCSSAIAPKMLVNLLAQQKTVSLVGCATQMFLFAAFTDAECLILAVMAYDRYMAICHPLLYTIAMSRRVCTSMVAGAYLSGGLTSLVHTSFTFTLSFCGSNVINHFFCDIPPLLEISCSNTHLNEVLLFTLCGFIQTSSFLTIAISYACILSTILRIHVAASRHKAFYTCTSHLMSIGLFYGSLLFTYLRPSSSYTLDTDKVVSAFYTVVFPMLNPLIYSLRNKEVKDALRRTAERRVFSQ